VNVQAAKGFRLGGVNDPLNLPLCTPQDEDLFGPFAGGYDDETLWNYEAGVKYSKGIDHRQRRHFPYRRSRTCRSRSMQEAARRVSSSTFPRLTPRVSRRSCRFAVEGLDLSLAGSYVSAEFDSTPGP
jgi:iron complex outermembrane receptor protein